MKWIDRFYQQKVSGKNYVVDYETKTVHTLRNEQKECRINDIKIKKFVEDDIGFILFGYKLCKWCYDY